MITASEALERLRQGNQRFVANAMESSSPLPAGTVPEQQPFAIILSCSDARVPAEMIFDHGLGDLFVIRVAGNIVTPSQLGSIEFAAEKFGPRLVVVMGHSPCGAIAATLQDLVTCAFRPAPTGPYPSASRQMTPRGCRAALRSPAP